MTQLEQIMKFAVVSIVTLAFLYFGYSQFELSKDLTTAVGAGFAAYLLTFLKSE